MNISSQNRYRTTLPPLFFGAGKVKLFSDFDGTYLPAEHKTISQAQHKRELLKLEDYFNQVRKFLEQSKTGFQFTVTTGRNLGEFQSILNHFQRLGLKMPLPDSVIIKNGADEYIKAIPDDEFYKSGSNPFSIVNEAKREHIKEAIGWDGKIIRENLINALKRYDFNIRQDATTNSASDYGKDSALYHVQDRYDQDGSHSPWTTILRQDGDLKFFIGLPKDMQVRDDRKHAQSMIQEMIAKDLKELCKQSNGHLSFSMKYRAQDGEYGNHPSITIIPKINGQELTKVYDTHKAVVDASTRNDLVITAGDGSNDFEMLNPARYIQLPQAENSNANLVDNPTEFLNYLNTNPELKKQFEKLPFLGIVVERNGHVPSTLKKLVDAYGGGANPKIIKVQEGHLFEGVLEAINTHRLQNPEFASLMGAELKNSISEFQKSGFYRDSQTLQSSPAHTTTFQNTLPIKDSPSVTSNSSSQASFLRNSVENIKKKIQALFNWLKIWFKRVFG